MTYQSNEISNQDGQPVSLYEFKWGNTFWRYTSADRPQTIQQTVNGVLTSVTYAPIAISDDGMVQGGSQNNDLTVTAQNDIELVELFRSTPPAGSIWLTVRRRHASDPATEFFVYWIGTVANVKKGGAVEAKIIGKSLLASFKRSGLRLAWTRNCPHMLYDSQCRADPADFEVEAEIIALGTDGSITVDAAGGHPAGYFDGGYLQWVVNGDGTTDQRGIESSVNGTTFVIFGSTDRLEVGMAVKLYPGCDLTGATCQAKFDNLVNYGGFEQMTGENPFDGRNNF